MTSEEIRKQIMDSAGVIVSSPLQDPVSLPNAPEDSSHDAQMRQEEDAQTEAISKTGDPESFRTEAAQDSRLLPARAGFKFKNLLGFALMVLLLAAPGIAIAEFKGGLVERIAKTSHWIPLAMLKSRTGLTQHATNLIGVIASLTWLLLYVSLRRWWVVGLCALYVGGQVALLLWAP